MKIHIPNFIKHISTLAVLVLAVFLSGCSSSPEVPLETNYYLLNGEQSAKKSININESVVVEVLEFPTYLHQPHLVIQLNKHQLHYARFDMWAESLQAGFTKALVNDLNLNNNSIQFVTDELHLDKKDDNKLMVRVNYFHPSTASKVVLSGVYWINNSKNKDIIQHHFSFEMLLNEDGYTHAVGQMRRLVSMMSEAILLDHFNMKAV